MAVASSEDATYSVGLDEVAYLESRMSGQVSGCRSGSFLGISSLNKKRGRGRLINLAKSDTIYNPDDPQPI